MILGINPLSSLGKVVNNGKKNAKVFGNKAFHSSPVRMVRNTGLALAAATMLSTLSSCKFFKKESPDDVVEVNSRIEKTDSSYSTVGEYRYRDNRIYKSYHYFPTDDNNVKAENYDWSETIYPDGRIERDSFGYKISITPSGKRTVVKTEQDEYGHVTVTKEYPDGTKVVRTDYKTGMPNEVLFVESSFWSNGNLKERNFYNEYPANKNNPDSAKVIEQSLYKYNENEVLLMWESSEIDSARSEKNNKYDRKGRLIYDDIMNEKYQYKFGSKIPFRAISEYDGCKRIKLFNKDGSIEREYFKAQDGTITEYNP